MPDIAIRPLEISEIPILAEFIYQALFQRQGTLPLPRAIINDPSIAVYIQNFGKRDDHALVAEIDGMIVGAVWTRILNGQVKGFGNLDDETPEFAISLLPEYRGRGIGTMLMKAMLKTLTRKGYKRASLAVQKDNYAVKMYQKTGFTIIETTDQEYIMVVQLQ